MSVHNKLYVKTELFANKVDGTDLSTADWAFLGTVDQNLAKTDEVEFKSVTVNNASFTTKLQTGATGNYTLTLPPDDGNDGDTLKTDGTGVLTWSSTAGFDQDLNTTDNVQFVDLNLTGNLVVSGTTTLIETTNLAISDNTIILNKDEVGLGVTAGTSGIEIERGGGVNYQLLFNEASTAWTVGELGGSLGTSVFKLVENADASKGTGIPGYDGAGRLALASGLDEPTVIQLQNIGLTTITAANWGHLASTDQDLSTTDAVTFDSITVTNALTLATPVADSVVTEVADSTITSGLTLYDTTAGVIPMVATLPDNVTKAGVCYTIMLKTYVNDLVITAAGSDTIEGNATCTMDIAGQHLRVCSCGDGVWIIM